MTLKRLSKADEQRYYALLSKIESGDNPNAKAKTSSASGRFQFIRKTWEGLGYKWSDVFNDKLQYEAIAKFTAQNEAALIAGGSYINFATLYAAHFLGVTGALKVLRGNPSDPISTVSTPAQRRANPTILKGTVKDFLDWLNRKTGDSVYKVYDNNPNVSAPPKPSTEYPKPSLWEIIVNVLRAIFQRK